MNWNENFKKSNEKNEMTKWNIKEKIIWKKPEKYKMKEEIKKQWNEKKINGKNNIKNKMKWIFEKWNDMKKKWNVKKNWNRKEIK